MQRGTIEHEPITIEQQTTFSYEKEEMIRNDQGKIVRGVDNKPLMEKRKVTIDKIKDNPIREIPDGWFLANVTDSDLPYEVILDSKRLDGLTVQGRNMEDFIHEAATLDRSTQTSVSAAASNLELSSINELQIQVLQEISKVQGTNLQSEAQESFEGNLISLSDQYIAVKAIIGEDKTAALSNEELNQWLDFTKLEQNDVSALLMFSLKHDNPEIFSHSLTLAEVAEAKRFENLGEVEKAKWFLNLDEDKPTIHYAIEKYAIKILKFLLDEAEPDLKKSTLEAVDRHGNNTLHHSLNCGKLEMLGMILKALDDNPDLKKNILGLGNQNGETPLHKAVR